MPEIVSLNTRLNIIEVTSLGTVSPEDVASSVREVERIHAETGIGKVLVDATQLTQFCSTARIYELSKTFPYFLRIAVLATEESKEKFDLAFAATVAQNHGILLHLFTSKSNAIEWLRA